MFFGSGCQPGCQVCGQFLRYIRGDIHVPRGLVCEQVLRETGLQLRNLIEDHVAPIGFPTEKRRFNPHLTIGRVHRRASKSEVREIGELVASSAIGTIGQIMVSSVSYLKSDLRPSGAVHTTMLEVVLGAGKVPDDAEGGLAA